MTPSQKSLSTLRSEAQELHRNVVALENEDMASTRFDLEKLQSKAMHLGESLKLHAKTEKGAVKASMHEAGVKLAAAQSKVDESIHETSDALKAKLEQAKVKLLDGMTSAVHSLSEAVAARRTSEHTSSATTTTPAKGLKS